MDMDANVPRALNSASASGSTVALVGGDADAPGEPLEMHHDDMIVRICSGSLNALDGALLIAKASIRDKSRPPLRPSTLFALVRALCRGGQPKRAFRLLSLCQTLGYGWGDRETMTNVIESLAEAGELVTAWGLYKRARADAVQTSAWVPSVSCASELIILLCKAGRADRALGVYVDVVTSRDAGKSESDDLLVRKTTMQARQGRLPYAKAVACLVVACTVEDTNVSGKQASAQVGARAPSDPRGSRLLTRATALYGQLLAMPGGISEASKAGVWRALIPALLASGDVLAAASAFEDAEAAGSTSASVGRGALAYLHAQVLERAKSAPDAASEAQLRDTAARIVARIRAATLREVKIEAEKPRVRRLRLSGGGEGGAPV